MADKKLAVSGLNAVSDSTKDAVLKAANVPHGAAKIVRDANGKVVEVIISLPESAAAAAQAAIEATPGVASVGVTDIIPGTEGWDGTQAGIDLLTASGYYIGPDMNSVSLAFDGGTCIMIPQMWGSSTYRIVGDGKLPSYPLQVDCEWKITYSADASCYSTVGLYNDIYKGAIQVYQGTIRILELTGQGNQADFTVGNGDALSHVYKASISPTGLVTAYMDSVEVGTLQLQDTQNTINNLTWFVNFGSLAGTATLDYVRWTKRP